MLLDTNIVIEIFKGNSDIKDQLSGTAILYISEITAMELYYGALNKRELQLIKSAIQCFTLLPVNSAISNTALSLTEVYAKSHSIMIPDALIAATALQHHFELYTLNLKDFKFIPNLSLYKPI